MRVVGAIAGFMAAGLAGCGTSQPVKLAPTVYVIDNGRTGWVTVYYNRSGEKDLPLENGRVVAHIGTDLKLFTHSRMNPSWEGAEFDYETPDGKRVRLSSADNDSRRIWAQDKNSDADGDRESFFVGDQDQFAKDMKPVKGVGSGFAEIQPVPAVPTDPDKPSEPGKSLDLPK